MTVAILFFATWLGIDLLIILTLAPGAARRRRASAPADRHRSSPLVFPGPRLWRHDRPARGRARHRVVSRAS